VAQAKPTSDSSEEKSGSDGDAFDPLMDLDTKVAYGRLIALKPANLSTTRPFDLVREFSAAGQEGKGHFLGKGVQAKARTAEYKFAYLDTKDGREKQTNDEAELQSDKYERRIATWVQGDVLSTEVHLDERNRLTEVSLKNIDAALPTLLQAPSSAPVRPPGSKGVIMMPIVDVRVAPEFDQEGLWLEWKQRELILKDDTHAYASVGDSGVFEAARAARVEIQTQGKRVRKPNTH
jgi:hypothetical protein